MRRLLFTSFALVTLAALAVTRPGASSARADCGPAPDEVVLVTYDEDTFLPTVTIFDGESEIPSDYVYCTAELLDDEGLVVYRLGAWVKPPNTKPTDPGFPDPKEIFGFPREGEQEGFANWLGSGKTKRSVTWLKNQPWEGYVTITTVDYNLDGVEIGRTTVVRLMP
jgi:hypothetical protein